MIYEVIAIAAIVVAGLYTSTRRAYLAELRDRAQRLEREHDQTSALAAAVERARIAREMHDSVAHHLTVIVALSDGARPRSPSRGPGLRCDPGVSTTAREALAETRRLLGILRPIQGRNSGGRCPGCPTSRVCSPESGRPGCRSGTNAPVPRGHAARRSAVIFRLVQEALTNTMKHAAPARARPSGCGSNPARSGSR